MVSRQIMPADQFLSLTHKCELVSFKSLTHLPQKNVNSVQFEKRIVHVNHALNEPGINLIPGSPILKEKSPGDCSFSVDPKCIVKLQKLRNSSKCLGKFPEIFRNSWIIFGNSDTLQDKNLMPLAQKKLYSSEISASDKLSFSW